MSATRAYSGPSPPLTRTSAIPSSVAAELRVRDLDEPAGVGADLVVVDLVDDEPAAGGRRGEAAAVLRDAAQLDQVRRASRRRRPSPPLRRGACTRSRRAQRARPSPRGPEGQPDPVALQLRRDRPGPSAPCHPRPGASRSLVLQGLAPGRGRPGGPCSPCRAALVPRHHALVPATVGCLLHDAQKALARLLARDDDAVRVRPAPARPVVPTSTAALRPAMTIARPYTSSLRRCRRPSYPPRRPQPDARTGHGLRDSARLSGDVDSSTPTRHAREGWRASARIPTPCRWSRSARSSRSSIRSSARAPARRSRIRCPPHGPSQSTQRQDRRRRRDRASPVPVLGTRHGRALAPRPRDPHRRHGDPARAGHAARRPGSPRTPASARLRPAAGRADQPAVARGARLQSGLQGAIAQLGERLDRTQEVGGSSPPSSITIDVPEIRDFARFDAAEGLGL